MTMTPEEIKTATDEFAKALGEKDEKPVGQIALMVEHLGKEWVQARIDETNKIEEGEGLKTDDGKRRRTKGGVFFYLSKGKMEDEVRAKIFPNFGSKGKVVEWEERHEYVDELIDDEEAQGNMRYVTITLHGRPGTVVKEDHSIMTTIQHTHKKTPLPKGVPHPPLTPTIYTVYMSRRHWEVVEETINAYKSDRLIVEGTVFYDGETETIAVFADRVTTRRLEKQAKKDAEEQQAEKKSSKPKAEQASADSSDADDVSDEPTAEPLSKLEKLQNAAQTLRERIAEMEASGSRGVNMTKKLLKNTEKQIEALQRSQDA